MSGHRLISNRSLATHVSRKNCRYPQRRCASSVPTSHAIYDVVCVGGGPAGLSLLAGLQSSPVTSNLKVALIESQELRVKQSEEFPPNNYSNRCSSLTPSSVSFLKRIEAWNRINLDRVQPYQEIQAWDGVSDSRISFDGSTNVVETDGSGFDEDPSTLAYMVENQNLVNGLFSRLAGLGGTSVFSGTRVESISLGQDTKSLDFTSWPVVRLSNGDSLTARLLVGADGFNSPVRSFADIPSRGWDYSRTGVVATLRLEDCGWGGSSRKIAYQRFLPTGPIAMLPLPGPYATLVWSTTPERASLLKRLSSEDFIALVNAGFRLSPADLDYLHSIEHGQVDELGWRDHQTFYDATKIPQRVVDVQSGSIAGFPLRLRHVDTYITERVALIGDAAHTMHPLAGQGLNAGQGDVAALLDTLTVALEHGQDIGSQLSLEPYNSRRYFANHAMLGAVDKLHKLYSVGGGPLVPLRSWGLSAVNSANFLKEFFMRRAAGV